MTCLVVHNSQSHGVTTFDCVLELIPSLFDCLVLGFCFILGRKMSALYTFVAAGCPKIMYALFKLF